MTELFNSLKALASSSSTAATTSIGNQFSSFHHHHQPLMTLGRADSCTESGFNQWRDAMRMVARLPGGLPPEFRIRLWENLADRYLQAHHIEWPRIASKCLNGNSRDQEISDQIEKDLHRTGCTGFSTGSAKQAVLKQVLVSYSRWNPAVGYCQGFNMIGAMLLQMTNGNEKLTLKIFIFLIEGVLPEGYFGQGLRGLAVEMAVFREILKFRKPTLNAHLTRLQKKDNSPPLTDVFTMHWFLTLFIHCLPPQTVLRIWDLILLEGSEILLRTSLVLWAAIETRILSVKNTDEFYSVMGVVTREMLEFGLMEPNALMKCVVSVGPFPFPGLEDLRQRQNAIMSKDAPCKSFFLAKRELDTLKRHYAAMRHRQRATTIIFRAPEPHPKGPNTRLLVVPTKKQVISPKPKVRRQGSGKSLNAASPLITNKNSTGHAHAGHAHAHAKNANAAAPNNSIIHVHGHGHSINHNHSNNRSKQVTVSWDKSLKNKFRRRRSSASSHTSTSSSTELCDSSSSDHEDSGSTFSQPIWVDPSQTLALVPKSEDGEGEGKTTTTTEITLTTTVDSPLPSLEIAKARSRHASSASGSSVNPTIVTDDSKIEDEIATRGPDPELDSLLFRFADTPENGNGTPNADGELSQPLPLTPKCIDTNDSQHFLDEMSKLGKSDSFYENLSQRICELQFQNLMLLTTCNTTIDKENSLTVERDLALSPSPLPSPISPIQSFYPHQDFSKLCASPNMKHLSPRGSISSNADSPLPRSPLSPSPDPNFGNLLPAPRKNSKSSVSSFELNEEKAAKGEGHVDSSETGIPESTSMSLAKPSQLDIDLVDPSPSSPKSLPLFVIPVTNGKHDADEVGGQEDDRVDNSQDAAPAMHVNADFSFSPERPASLEPSSSSGFLTATTDTTFGASASPSECNQTSEDDINTVIRENIAILQRLKMKPAYGEDTGDDFDYFAYYSSDTDDDEAFRKDGKTATAVGKVVVSQGQAHAAVTGAAMPKTRTRSRSNSNSTSSKTCAKCSVKTHKPKKPFNPFPTTRRPRVKSTKFGLYAS